MNIETLYDLFVHELRGMYYVETRLVDELPALADNAMVDSLDDTTPTEFIESVSDAFAEHATETESQVDRLDDVFETLPFQPDTREREVAALDGLLREVEQFDHIILNDALRNPFYLDAAAKVEQLEIKGYENLLQLADALDLAGDATDPLEENLDEERDALSTLEDLSTGEQMESILGDLGDEDPIV
ncbi:YciE/YciF ferroxidase family protein [Haladaptatus salinisoli]|uniref:YciE/YciF ferroxidase family protein n=1 Tax=Haladaptatus salinisoli TaxID=2884876 RepID=UPI001D0BD876|nr:DUF892 family protein [Haladaptatus salinisoli]